MPVGHCPLPLLMCTGDIPGCHLADSPHRFKFKYEQSSPGFHLQGHTSVHILEVVYIGDASAG